MSYLNTTTRLAVSFALLLSASPVSAGKVTLYDGEFTRFPAERDSGRSVAAHCQIDDVTSPDHWADATSHLTLSQDATSSVVTVSMENSRPNTLFTIWLMLAGGSPLMKTGATALVSSADLPEAVEIMQSPTTEATNGFTTDENGNGSVTLALDFPIVGGAYPFQRYEGFDPENAAFNREKPRAIPVAIPDASTGVPFTLRLASHCGDNLHNGLVAGQHEPWFDWLAQ
ncbi:MAG: hypothetical protein AAGF94_13415 [Pseudomonadota bacterium]